MSQVRGKSYPPVKRKKRGGDTKAALLLLPSFLIVSVFIYVFITYTIGVSLAENWMPAKPSMAQGPDPFATYKNLFENPRFQSDLRNSFIFTVLFLLLTVIAGFFIALAVHNMGRTKGFFRGVFLLPYALSFIVTGVVWRWLFNPDSGVNLFLKYSGVASAYKSITGEELRPEWLTSATTVGDVSALLEKIIPGGQYIQVEMGIPLALIPVVIATSWQLLGFAMAMFLAGLVSIPEELREASMMDGATGSRYYRSIAVPMLAPIAITTLVILTHVALKIFDLIYAMSGSGIGFATDMPGIFVYESMYKALKYNTGAAASIVMLIIVCIVVVPYLVHSNRESKGR
jgi:glucose/mannose transport system permease protein